MNPLNPRKLHFETNESTRHCHSCVCRGNVGGGFIRPEVRTFVNSARITSTNAKRGNLGTDKSVPYKKPTNPPTTNAIF
ncbi:MAG: hypothetical protein FWG87_10560 [Defluviitaleaceae bacterium]|nr:hypothetical protein [Defluviitaleaceae bacterium]